MRSTTPTTTALRCHLPTADDDESCSIRAGIAESSVSLCLVHSRRPNFFISLQQHFVYLLLIFFLGVEIRHVKIIIIRLFSPFPHLKTELLHSAIFCCHCTVDSNRSPFPALHFPGFIYVYCIKIITTKKRNWNRYQKKIRKNRVKTSSSSQSWSSRKLTPARSVLKAKVNNNNNKNNFPFFFFSSPSP